MSDPTIASVATQTTTRNPYVGPRAFTYADKNYFFGRDREARDLLAHVISQRLLLFYAQSGAGKSSLINTRLVPQLREAGFSVLPVGRMGGDLPEGISEVDNVFCFNLMLSLDKSDSVASRFAHLPLSRFLEHLTTDDGVTWHYDDLPSNSDLDMELGSVDAPEKADLSTPSAHENPAQSTSLNPVSSGDNEEGSGFPYVLIIDQFEELLTHHPARWQERDGFFQQLNDAMRRDPYLWVVLTLREDYIAGLEPYASMMEDRLRARFYMQRMGIDAAIEAVRDPAEKEDRPFEPGMAEQLVNNLSEIRVPGLKPYASMLEDRLRARFYMQRMGIDAAIEAVRDPAEKEDRPFEPDMDEQLVHNLSEIRVPGQEQSYPGEFVEPVQLQVVCYQLWQRIQDRPPGPITAQDLKEAGDVDLALRQFYNSVLGAVAPQHGLSERALRIWFEETLITQDGTRSTVYQGAEKTAGLANEVVRDLANRFLLRREQRAGGYWIELSHDRFVDPIRAANAAWRKTYDNPLETGYRRWNGASRTYEHLLTGATLRAAETFVKKHPHDVTPDERDFLELSQEHEKALAAAALYERNRRIVYAVFAATLIALLSALAIWGWTSAAEAKKNAELANQQLALLEIEQLVQEGRRLKGFCEVTEAIAAFESASLADAERAEKMATEIDDTRRQCATQLVHEGEQLAAQGDYEGAAAKFQAALALEPPPDTPVYVWIAGGEFMMGSNDDETQHKVELEGFWIQRTEVTNAQYRRCVEEGVCDPPENQRWPLDQFANQPIFDVSWHQANTYAAWVGGRLPTEAEWEYACRGTDGRIFPWGYEDPDPDRLNYYDSGLATWTAVGSYPPGANGLYDMGGNVWEWTSSQGKFYPYDSSDGREDPEGEDYRTMRGGSFNYNVDSSVRCAFRISLSPDVRDDFIGFRVAVSPGFWPLDSGNSEIPDISDSESPLPTPDQ